jgi:hypothetical protein
MWLDWLTVVMMRFHHHGVILFGQMKAMTLLSLFSAAFGELTLSTITVIRAFFLVPYSLAKNVALI